MEYWFIINPRSGKKNKAGEIKNLIKQHFLHQKSHQYRLIFTEGPGHGRIIAREAVSEGIDYVVSVGGDGTMNEVAGGLVNSETIFGVIPTGSGNGFARSLGIPLDAGKAISFILNSHPRSVDVGRIADDYFFGVAGVGFDALIGARFQEFGHRGPLPYFYIGVKEYFKYQFEEFRIISKEYTNSVRPLLITIANSSQYGNGAVIAPGADLEDGLLDVCIIEKIPFVEGLLKVGALFNNKIDSLSSYNRFMTTEVKIIRSGKNCLYHVDGEPKKGQAELTFKILPKALNVCSQKQEQGGVV
ncbi:MAG: diacylglycerol kinase family protein [Calditrichaceae bacterium]